jgi:hypothetical protein
MDNQRRVLAVGAVPGADVIYAPSVFVDVTAYLEIKLSLVTEREVAAASAPSRRAGQGPLRGGLRADPLRLGPLKACSF